MDQNYNHNRSHRAHRWLTALAGLLALIFGASFAGAQAPPRTLADSLEAARKQRLALEAAVERQLATGIAERAKSLSMSNEIGALQRLETLLDSAQIRLLAQRDRIRLLRDAAMQTDKAILVVMIRMDAAPQGEMNAAVIVNGATQKSATVTAEQMRAMVAGGAVELYRAELPPAEQRVTVNFLGGAINLTESMTQALTPGQVRYIEFAVRGGRIVPTTWTSRSAPPE
jgi:hypothetical protein